MQAAQRKAQELEAAQRSRRGWTPFNRNGSRQDPLTVPARKADAAPAPSEPAVIVQEQRALEEMTQIQARALREQERR